MPCPNATLGTMRPTNPCFCKIALRIAVHCESTPHYLVIPNEVEGSAFCFLFDS